MNSRTVSAAVTAGTVMRAVRWPRRSSMSLIGPLAMTPMTAPTPITSSSRFESTWLIPYWPETNSVPNVWMPAMK
ncbi:MAG TPA: hypothetical protein VGG75_09470 [Trebonia sp.]